MSDIEFNLLTEPWIRVMDENCTVKEVSLTDALIYSHEYKGLAGELPTQDAAVLRLLLAVLHAVFERVDIDGNESEIEECDDALDRWESLWKNEHFPEKPIKEYLESQKENFWLFHPTRPFWQVSQAKSGTGYDASKLNGALSESSNKLRLFPDRTCEERNRLTYSEAARWLLYVNAFDDTSAKPTKAGKAANDGKLPSPGAGWLGKLGYVSLLGESLFQTLMMNFVLLDRNKEPWTSCIPSWELETPKTEERVQIPIPNDQAAILTLQSRRLFLLRDGKYITGYYLLGGDFFDKENSFVEQMTVWGKIKDKNGNCIGYQPRRHDRTRQMWRDFAMYTSALNDSNSELPGIIRWNALLQCEKILPLTGLLDLTIASIQYGDKDFFAADVFSDYLSIHMNLLSDIGDVWRTLICNEIETCDKIARQIGFLASELFIAAGGDIEKRNQPMTKAREQFYYAVDIPFRKWLSGLNAEDIDTTAKVSVWRKEAKTIAFKLANEMVKNAGTAAFVGKKAKENKNDPGRYYSSSIAMNKFIAYMKNITEGDTQ